MTILSSYLTSFIPLNQLSIQQLVDSNNQQLPPKLARITLLNKYSLPCDMWVKDLSGRWEKHLYQEDTWK